MEDNKIGLFYSENISPWKKYEKYKIFPIRLFVHIILAIFSILQITLLLTKLTNFSRSQEYIFYNKFIGEDEKEGGEIKRDLFIYSISELKNIIVLSLNNYNTFSINSLEKIENFKNPQIQFSFYSDLRINSEEFSNININNFNNISIKNLGIFELDKIMLKKILLNVSNIVISYNIRTYLPIFYGNNAECIDWIIDQNYDLIERSNIHLTLSINRQFCQGYNNISFLSKLISKLYFIHVAVLIFSLFSLYFSINYISLIAKIYLYNKKDINEKNRQEFKSFSKSEDSEYYNPLLDVDENMKLLNYDKNYTNKKSINLSNIRVLSFTEDDNRKDQEEATENYNLNLGWTIICLIGNCFQIIGSLLSIIEVSNDMTTSEMIIGFGTLCCIINLGRYLEYSIDYGKIYNTITLSMPTTIRYLTGVAPVFFGYILLGLCIFAKSDYFSSTSSAFLTLFSLSQGDSTLDIFKDLGSISSFFGFLYTFTFCSFFFVMVMNVFIAIIEDAFTINSMKTKNHWIYDYIDIANPNNIKYKGDNVIEYTKLNKLNIHLDKLQVYLEETKEIINSKEKGLTREELKILNEFIISLNVKINEIKNRK